MNKSHKIANIDIGLIDGSFIKSLRIKLKLSKKEFSNILGISTFKYDWIETGFEYISHIDKTLFYLLDKQPELLNLLYD
jgi:DNA-binding transcriptional regulator YiaG